MLICKRYCLDTAKIQQSTRQTKDKRVFFAALGKIFQVECVEQG